MTAFEVDFLGCKISHTDAETIRDALEQAGHAPGGAAALIQVVNTCCITREAERKSRQRIRRMLEAGGDDARVFVTGCGAANLPEQYASIDERVTVLPGPAALSAASIVDAADALAGLGCRGATPAAAPRRRARAFVKVQDGCSFSCSYCIVPAVRGAPRSRTREAILDEVARRVARGQTEIVLTGVNIGLYRDAESRAGLDRLLLDLADVAGVSRVRVSSIEVNHVNRRLVAAMASHPKICPHLHVPLQSGDDAVLAAMRRHYDTRRYAAAIDAARAELPQLNLTTDVIVGFPAEDDAAFERTAAFIDELGFTKVHAFPFSGRPGTDAAALHDPVPKAVKSQRSARLREIADAAALRHRGRLVGRLDEVIVEARAAAGYGSRAGVLLTDDHAAVPDSASAAAHTGYTRDYSPVRLIDDACRFQDGQLVEVRLRCLDAATGVLEAEIPD